MENNDVEGGKKQSRLSGFARFIGSPRSVAVGIVLLFALGIVALYRSAPTTHVRPARAELPVVATVLVQPASVTPEVASQGIARPQSSLTLALDSPGEVIAISDRFRSGAKVEQGDQLLALDPEPFELDITRRRHELASARLHLEKAEANATIARRNPGRNATDFALNKPQISEARARVSVAQAELAMAKRNLRRANLTAPFSGRLDDVHIALGQNLAAGQALGEIYSAGQMEVRLPVRDEWLRLLDLAGDNPARSLSIPVTLRGEFGGRELHWSGVITRREGGLSKNQMSWLVAEVTADSGAVPLEPGIYVEAAIKGRLVKDIAVLPRSVLIDGHSVWRVGEHNRISRQTVEWVYRDDQSVYISAGLSAGERVLETGRGQLLEGAHIQPRDAGTEPALSQQASAP
ncbi:efflux RND transporter periplasmic adaptor subunit [Marinobacter sp. 1Y8]